MPRRRHAKANWMSFGTSSDCATRQCYGTEQNNFATVSSYWHYFCLKVSQPLEFLLASTKLFLRMVHASLSHDRTPEHADRRLTTHHPRLSHSVGMDLNGLLHNAYRFPLLHPPAPAAGGDHVVSSSNSSGTRRAGWGLVSQKASPHGDIQLGHRTLLQLEK